jgi:hypothetical protein
MKIQRLLTLAFLVVASGCGSTRGNTSPEGTSCSDVCANIALQCGATPPTCAASCVSWGPVLKSCLSTASSCDAVMVCADAPESDAGTPDDAGADEIDGNVPNPDPCSRCTGSEYCVRDPGTETRRCWAPPVSCNSELSSDCDECVYYAGTACAAGARGCSSGAAGRTIDCM